MRKVVISLVACLILCSGVFAQDFGYLTNMGISGGELGDVAINPTTPEVMYVATTWGDGIFKSIDGGTSWSTIEALRGASRGSKVVFDPKDPNIVYYARQGGIYKSTDGGTAWTDLQINYVFDSLAIASSSPQVLYASRGIGEGATRKRDVIKTVDGGVNWTGTGFPTIEAGEENRIMCLAVDPTNPDLVFAGSGTSYREIWGNLWKSSDGGTTWTTAIATTENWIGYSAAFRGTNEVYVPTKKGVYRSTGTFESWTLVMDANGNDASGYPYKEGLSVDVGSDGTIYVGTTHAVWKSSTGDPGSWQRTNYYQKIPPNFVSPEPPVLNVEPRQVKVHPKNSNIIYAGSGFGLHKSINGGTSWESAYSGMTACQIWNVKKAGTTLYAGAERSAYKSIDGGTTWSVFKATPTRIRAVAVDPTDSNRIFTAYGGGEHTLAYTRDGGTNWNYPLFVHSRFEVSSFAINPVTPEVVYAAGGDYVQNTIGGLYKTINGGTTWTSVETFPSVNNCLQKVVLDPKNPEIVYVGVSAIHYSNTPGGLYKSINGGATWEALLGNNYPINDILIDPNDTNIIYIALTADAPRRADTVHKTIDGGKNWSDISSGISSSTDIAEVTSLAFDPNDSRIVYAGVNPQKGIYVSVNRGASWSKLAPCIYDIMDVETGSLYAGTSGGLFSYAGLQIAPYTEAGDKPVIYNYPNPFNPATGSTTISFSLPSGISGSTTVKIFDLSGELVRTLISQQSMGDETNYKTSWDGKNDKDEVVASGVYIALIVVNGKPQYSKIAVIK